MASAKGTTTRLNPVVGPQSHPIAGVGAKRLVEAVVAGQHPARQLCS